MSEAPAVSNRARWIRVAAVMVITLVVLASFFVFTLEDNAQASNVTSEVRAAFARHLQNFSTANATLLSEDYTPGATLIWTGNARNLEGEYANASVIKEFFSHYFLVFSSVSVKNATYSVQEVKSGVAVNGSLELLGGATSGQSMMASANTSTTYVRDDGNWVISSETWTFVTFFLEGNLD